MYSVSFLEGGPASKEMDSRLRPIRVGDLQGLPKPQLPSDIPEGIHDRGPYALYSRVLRAVGGGGSGLGYTLVFGA